MYLLFDIGGTKTRIAVSRDKKEIEEPKIINTPKDFAEGIDMLVETAQDLARGEAIEAAAGGVAGPVDQQNGVLRNAPNLPGWIGKPIKNELQTKLDTLVSLHNDTDVVGLGEVVYGAGKGFDIAVYLTISTGVGGSRFVDGSIDRNAFGFEPGHQIIDASGELCPECYASGHRDLEGYISGSAFERRYKKKPYEVTDPEAWEQAAEWLAYGLTNTIVHWSPEVIVLGGSMIVGDPAIPFNRILFHLKNTLDIFPELPTIRKAELGSTGGLYGALALLHNRFSSL